MPHFQTYRRQDTGYWVPARRSYTEPFGSLEPGEICRERVETGERLGSKTFGYYKKVTTWKGDPALVADYKSGDWRGIGWTPPDSVIEDAATMPGFILLGRMPGANDWIGYVENSFSMAVDLERTRFWWSGVGIDNVFGVKHQVDGKRNAEGHLEAFVRHMPRDKREGFEVEMFDVRGDDLPVEIDWQDWIMAHEPLDAGHYKFRKRNVPFHMPGELAERDAA